MTNTQLLYSQHVENVKHNRAMEQAQAETIATEQERNRLTSRQLDITEEYNRENLDIQRRKLAQDWAINQIANELKDRELTQKQQQFVDSWEQNALRQSAELARQDAETARTKAQTDATIAKAISENPVGYLAVKGTDGLFASLPGAKQVVSKLWPSLGEALDKDLATGEKLIGGTSYTNQQKVEIAAKVEKAIENLPFSFSVGGGVLPREKPLTQRLLWEKCAPGEEVQAWSSLTKSQQREKFGDSLPWEAQFWQDKYSWYRQNFRSKQDQLNAGTAVMHDDLQNQFLPKSKRKG